MSVNAECDFKRVKGNLFWTEVIYHSYKCTAEDVGSAITHDTKLKIRKNYALISKPLQKCASLLDHGTVSFLRHLPHKRLLHAVIAHSGISKSKIKRV
jgi:hypothetical protein